MSEIALGLWRQLQLGVHVRVETEDETDLVCRVPGQLQHLPVHFGAQRRPDRESDPKLAAADWLNTATPECVQGRRRYSQRPAF